MFTSEASKSLPDYASTIAQRTTASLVRIVISGKAMSALLESEMHNSINRNTLCSGQQARRLVRGI
jgi:hypothetical protein